MAELRFPVPISELQEWLPHRGPAIWIDEVLEINPDGGTCRITPRPGARFLGPYGKVRPTSYIEFMAQAYGYVSACQALCGLIEAQYPTEVYLVQVKDLWTKSELETCPTAPAKTLEVRVATTHRFGSITLIDGQVHDEQRTLLAQASIRVYARQNQ